jgi:hypothetical protein
MQLAIAGLLTLATIVVKATQQRCKLVKELQARDVGLFDLSTTFS